MVRTEKQGTPQRSFGPIRASAPVVAYRQIVVRSDVSSSEVNQHGKGGDGLRDISQFEIQAPQQIPRRWKFTSFLQQIQCQISGGQCRAGSRNLPSLGEPGVNG